MNKSKPSFIVKPSSLLQLNRPRLYFISCEPIHSGTAPWLHSLNRQRLLTTLWGITSEATKYSTLWLSLEKLIATLGCVLLFPPMFLWLCSPIFKSMLSFHVKKFQLFPIGSSWNSFLQWGQELHIHSSRSPQKELVRLLQVAVEELSLTHASVMLTQ